jgi:outer membrane protein insertion porin family
VLSLTAEGGYIFGLDDNVRIEDRFFVGGDNLRGFANGGIGPRDSITRDALGGNIYYVGSLTLGFPLGLPQELGLSGRVFSDFGSLWKIDQPTTTTTTATVLDVKSIRVSAGVGVSWQSPLGPIRVDLGAPVKRESFDKTEVFRVSFGTRF